MATLMREPKVEEAASPDIDALLQHPEEKRVPPRLGLVANEVYAT